MDKNAEDTWRDFTSILTKIRKGQYEEGLHDLEKLASEGRPEIYALTGRVIEDEDPSSDRLNKAKRVYQKGIRRGDREDCPVQLGRLYLNEGSGGLALKRAIVYFRMAERSGYWKGSFGLGLAYLMRGKGEDIDRSIMHFCRSLRKGNLISLSLIGTAAQRRGNYITGALLRLVGFIVCLPFLVIAPNSRFVKTL